MIKIEPEMVKVLLKYPSYLINNEAALLLHRNQFNQTFLMLAARPPLFPIYMTYYRKTLLKIPLDEIESLLLAENLRFPLF